MRTGNKNVKWLSVFQVMSLSVLAAMSAPAAVHYVNVNNTAPSPPYFSWSTAATNIQDAVDVALAGDEIVVTNGLYLSGESAGPADTGSNRVTVSKPLNLHSVNGPDVTVIGGLDAVRCVYLTNGVTLNGFTLANGVGNGNGLQEGGGVLCESTNALITNCILASNVAHNGGGARDGTLNNCILAGNVSHGNGGGANGSTLNNCTVTNNDAGVGGGVYGGTANHCVFARNIAPLGAGGASGSTLNDCTLSNNLSQAGSGAGDSTLTNCTLIRNSALFGGAVAGCRVFNCVLIGNSASEGGAALSSTLNSCLLTGNSGGFGAAANDCALNNCTIASNAAVQIGGGVFGCTLNNCIAYFNTAPVAPNFDATSILNYCCTQPLPASGAGNFTNSPLFVDLAGGNLRLQSDSPCIDAGNNSYVTTETDLDGNPRVSDGVVDVGAYESVFTRDMEISRLMLMTEDSNVEIKNQKPLLAALEAALASFERGNVTSGINQLKAFQNKVAAQVVRIDAALAGELIDRAQRIIEEFQHN
jgi:hypothetical protein